jgi:hypothetical protein
MPPKRHADANSQFSHPAHFRSSAMKRVPSRRSVTNKTNSDDCNGPIMDCRAAKSTPRTLKRKGRCLRATTTAPGLGCRWCRSQSCAPETKPPIVRAAVEEPDCGGSGCPPITSEGLTRGTLRRLPAWWAHLRCTWSAAHSGSRHRPLFLRQ